MSSSRAASASRATSAASADARSASRADAALASATLPLIQTQGRFTPGTTWIAWPTNPLGDWSHFEDYGALYGRSVQVRLLVELEPGNRVACFPLAGIELNALLFCTVSFERELLRLALQSSGVLVGARELRLEPDDGLVVSV